MTLLITVFAAVISTAVWYAKLPDNSYRISMLCYMYWGASIMWLVDAVFEYAEQGADFFNPPVSDMVNDAFLGFSAVALGLIIWIISLLIHDPKGVLKSSYKKTSRR